jgi:excisionase family DNA binding protein
MRSMRHGSPLEGSRTMNDIKSEKPDFLTKTQVAELIGVSTRTIDNLMRRGQLPYLKLSERLVRFPRTDLKIRLQGLIVNSK